ncbi:MAG TPA: phosphoribosylamine--glycine ligase [Dehalococcoidia bacterium]|nr:phosphoribosylamine--glycine ligase [Dehalococcoidia bacterium]
MNVLLIGSGGRAHAIAWKLRQSSRLTDLYVAPGNGGTAALATNLDLPIPRTTASKAEVDGYLDAAVAKAKELRADLVFVAPDDPLAWGLVDRLEAAGIAAFGPTQAAAQLEASKSWAKDLMRRYGIPHTPTLVFDDHEAARDYARSANTQLVVKADGLAVGKGAIVTSSTEEALAAIDELAKLGESARRLTIEERVFAREVSGHAFSDGKTVRPMPLSCDHKAVFDGNRGPNTGGMGVYSPPWWASEGLQDEITVRILEPLGRAMAAEGRPFRGIIYPGVFVNESGIQVFECNARFGDPEAQALLVRLESDLLDIVWAAVNGRLHEVDMRWTPRPSVCVVLASGGYPGSYRTGLPITGIEDVDPGVRVFHAGTRRLEDGSLVTAGGRVLNVVATGSDLEEARRRAYENVGRIRFEGMHFRRDIALQSGE